MSLPDCALTIADTATTTSAALHIHFICVSPYLTHDAMRLLHDVNVETGPKYSAPVPTEPASVRAEYFRG
jgi:CDP-diacylglycerol pyrophosphatase